MHLKYFKQLLTKICLFENQISKDIKFDAFENIGNTNNNNEDKQKQVVVDISENILATSIPIIEEKKNVKTMIKRNVKKLFGGINFFKMSRDECDDESEILRSASSTSEMEGVAKSIQSEIHDLENNVQESLTKFKRHDAINVVKPIVNAIIDDVFKKVQENVEYQEQHELLAESSTESVTESLVESVTEPVVETLSEPVTETLVKPVTEPVTESVVEESVAESVSESLAESVVESVTDNIVIEISEKPSKPKRKYRKKNGKQPL